MSFAHLTIPTRDVAATADFFINVFGWQHVRTPDNIVMTAAWLRIGPHQQLHLVHRDDFDPSAFEDEFGRHAAFFIPRPEFDALKKRLTDHGAELVAPKRDTPFQRFFFKDPNGYLFEIIEAGVD